LVAYSSGRFAIETATQSAAAIATEATRRAAARAFRSASFCTGDSPD